MSPSVCGAAALVLAASLGLSAPAEARSGATGIWKNCTEYNKTYAHGVGRSNAVDHSSGTPVTNFLHSTRKYNVAMDHNKSLDRDKDGIACEQA